MQRDFREALKAADEALAAQGMSQKADRRLRERLGLADKRPATVPWRLFAVAAVGAACVALVATWRSAPQSVSELGGFALSASDVSVGFATRAKVFAAFNANAGWNPQP